MTAQFRGWGLTALVLASASCASPVAGLGPREGGTAPMQPVATGTVAPQAPPASMAPGSAAPSLPPTPPRAVDARVRLVGVVDFNGTPVSGASVVAQDLATGKALPLAPWAAPLQAGPSLQTIETDVQGQFDLAILPSQPQSADDAAGQLVKVIITKGSQAFTTIFNDRGQAVGGEEISSATYTLKQGQASVITVRLHLTPASTAATQAFEGALRVTFQVPGQKRAERHAAVLEAARQAARAVTQALAQRPDVAGRIVSSLNASGEVSQREAFRTAISNLGIFAELFRAVQRELLTLSTEKLVHFNTLAPIQAGHFPLDDVVISPSGFLGFSGQQQPILLAGREQGSFVPSPARGGGNATAQPTPSPGPRWFTVYTLLGNYPAGLVYSRPAIRGAQLLYTVGSNDTGNWLNVDSEPAEASGTLTVPGLTDIAAVAQARTASQTLYFGSNTGVGYYVPDSETTGKLEPTGAYYAVAADSTRVYYVKHSGTAQSVMWRSHADFNASGVIQANSGPWQVGDAYSMAVFDPAVDGTATSTASPTIFVGTPQGSVFSAQDGGSAVTLVTGIGQVLGLAFATPVLYIANHDQERLLTLNVNTRATDVLLATATDPVNGPSSPFRPLGLSLDDEAENLYVADLNGGRIIRVPLAR